MRGKGLGWGVVGLALAILVLPTPTTFGASASSITIKAPYWNAISTAGHYNQKYGCGAHSLGVAPSFHRITGRAVFSGNVTAPTCPTNLGATLNEGGLGGGVSITLPFHSPPKGYYKVSANWRITVAGWTNITPGTCAVAPPTTKSPDRGCTIVAAESIYLFAYLYDLTTKTQYTYPSGGFAANEENGTSCIFRMGCTYQQTSFHGGTITGNYTWSANWSLQMYPAQHYELLLEIKAGMSAYIQTTRAHLTGASAFASMNLATSGNGAVLTSVTLS